MPDKPAWIGRLEEAIEQLRAFPFPWVDRATLEEVLGVGRRRAQQILEPCVSRRIGASGVADREELIARLRALATGETAQYERRRRERLARQLEEMRRSRLERPRVLVEAPVSMVNQELASLPEGVSVGPGEITVQFTTAVEALEKLLALAMAAGNDPDGFERLTSAARTAQSPALPAR